MSLESQGDFGLGVPRNSSLEALKLLTAYLWMGKDNRLFHLFSVEEFSNTHPRSLTSFKVGILVNGIA